MIRLICFLQGIYFLITGAWPLLHMKSFILVTGHKTDLWLVEMVGALTTAISLYLLITSYRNRMSMEGIIMVITATLGYLLIDIIYVSKHVISAVYLADGFVEIVFLSLWIYILLKSELRKRIE